MEKVKPSKDCLKSFPLMEGINQDVVREVAKKCEQLEFKRRDIIYAQNENEVNFYFLIKGEVKLSWLLNDGKEMAYRFAIPGEVFGEMVLKDQTALSDFAQVISSKVTVLCIHKNELLHLLAQEPKWEKNLSDLCLQRLQSSRKRHEQLVQYNSKERIHLFLIELMDKKGKKVGMEDLTDFPYTHHDVAAYTQTSRQAVTSLLGELRKGEHIHLERGRLLIRDLASFKKLKFRIQHNH